MQRRIYNLNCPNCNSRLSPGATQCPECGADRVTVVEPPQATPPPAPAPQQQAPPAPVPTPESQTQTRPQYIPVETPVPAPRRVPVINYEVPATGSAAFILFCVLAAILGAFALFGLFWFMIFFLAVLASL